MADDMTRAKDLIEANEDQADFDGPLPLADIDLAAHLLGLALPAAWRDFLSTFGVGAFGAAEFYGLIAGKIPAPSAPCAVFSTMEERRDADFPADFVVIQSSGHGPLYCLATSETVDGDCPVREWNYARVARDASSPVAESFAGHFRRATEAEIS